MSVYAWKLVERDDGCGYLAGDARDAASSGLVKSVSSCKASIDKWEGKRQAWRADGARVGKMVSGEMIRGNAAGGGNGLR